MRLRVLLMLGILCPVILDGCAISRTVSVDVQGTERVLDAHAPEVCACAKGAAPDHVVIDFDVSSGGEAAQIQVGPEGTQAPEVRHCIQGVIQKLRFPKPRGASEHVRYPIYCTNGPRR
jgi:hypothetical protein